MREKSLAYLRRPFGHLKEKIDACLINVGGWKLVAILKAPIDFSLLDGLCCP
jgi:hypothetical protein